MAAAALAPYSTGDMLSMQELFAENCGMEGGQSKTKTHTHFSEVCMGRTPTRLLSVLRGTEESCTRGYSRTNHQPASPVDTGPPAAIHLMAGVEHACPKLTAPVSAVSGTQAQPPEPSPP